jgi:hypothetical protein
MAEILRQVMKHLVGIFRGKEDPGQLFQSKRFIKPPFEFQCDFFYVTLLNLIYARMYSFRQLTVLDLPHTMINRSE